MPDDDVPWQLLERYCAGPVTQEDLEQLESWLAGDPTRRVLVERLRALFVRQMPRPTESDIERAWERLAAAIDQGPGQARADRTRGHWRRFLTIGVGALVLVAIGWYLARSAGR